MTLDFLPKLLANKKIILGICGSIAIYKSIEILRNLQKLGASVRVVMSDDSQKFINPLLFEALCGYQVLTTQSQNWGEIPHNHIEIASWGDIFLIAPISANSLNKVAYGIADNILLESFLAFDGPKLIAPAANTKMLQNPATQSALNLLIQRGIAIIPSQSKELACKTIGDGALADPLEITYQTIHAFYQEKFWENKALCITSGGSKENIDSVRYLSNHSSGKMGASLALAGYFLGAKVTYIGSLCPYPLPLRINYNSAQSTQDFLQSIQKWQESNAFSKDSFLFMSAAISDYTPKESFQGKLKKEAIGQEWNLCLQKNLDILSTISKKQTTIGFKLESQNGLENAIKALQNKNLDAICLNEISPSLNPMNATENQITWVSQKSQKNLGKSDKLTLAFQIFNEAKSL